MDLLNILQWNSQSILCNRLYLTHFLYEQDIHLAIICETWLRPETIFKIKGFNVVIHDSGNKHNGVAILIKDTIQYKHLPTFSDNGLQIICVTIFLNNKELSLISCYCPTYSYPRFDKTKLDNLIKSIPHPFILAGDFNAHNTSWGCNSTSRRGREILDVINDNYLVLLNDGQVTTVGSSSWRPNALDLTIVSPELAMSCEWSVHNDPLGSYHLPVLIKFHLTTATDIHNTLHTTLPVYPNYKCVDWNSYKNRVDVGLQKINFSQYSSLESYDIFCKLLVDSAQACSGVSRSKQNISSRKGRIPRPRLPWWNLKCFDAVVKY